MAEPKNPPPRDFVDALVEDPANPPQLQALTGYRGRSAEEGHTRLYLDPELTGWVDIPDEAILLTRETQDEYGLGKSLVWTKLDAQLKQGPQTGGGTGADFLRGQVAQDLGGGAGLGGAQPIRTLIGCPTHAPFLCPVTPPRLCPKTCAPKTLTPEECPTLGITCTALPPQCPQRTVNPEQCPTFGFTCTAVAPQCPPRTFTPQECPSLGIACTALPPCPTRDVAQCIPQPTSSPQFCPVATPVGGCPGGGIGDPGGPVEFGQQGAQGFAGQPQAFLQTLQPWCPTQNLCFTQDLRLCPQNVPVQIQPSAQIVCQLHRTVQEPQCWQIVTRQPRCWITRIQEICQPIPVSPWCPITGPITGPTTTPVQITVVGGAGQFGGGQFGGAVQGFEGQGMGAQAFNAQQNTAFCPVQQQQPSVQICQAPTLAANCLQNTRNQICQITVMTRPDVCQTGWPTLGACPSLACPTQGCPFGGGGGFGGGF